jgi:predicted amidohydrolase YtcJ
MPDLVLYNANVITMDSVCPKADAVFVKDGIIAGVVRGPNRRETGKTEMIDCKGKTIIPGFIDAHCHLAAYAEKMISLELSPQAGIRSLSNIRNRIKEFCSGKPEETWIRGKGYNEFYLKEKRHPDRHDLDKAAPLHPVKLTHRSGHAHVLNSLALKLVGITSESGDPPDGLIDRDLETGEPTGILFGMGSYLAKRIPTLEESEIREGVRRVSDELLSLGITSIQDATSHNDAVKWTALRKWKTEGDFRPAVTVMIGAHGLNWYKENLYPHDINADNIRTSGVKIIVHEVTGELYPPQERLNRMVLDIHQAGLQTALHCVEENTIAAACRAIEYALQHIPRGDHRHRIEHCSVCPPDLIKRIALLGIVVVTQPSFLYYSGDRYLETVPPEQLKNLYPFGSFIQKKVRVASGSDFPISQPNPLIGIAAAVTRKSDSGKVVIPAESVECMNALSMYTKDAAFACFDEKTRGSITVGKAADLVVLNADPTRVSADEIRKIKVEMTLIGGEIVWHRKT